MLIDVSANARKQTTNFQPILPYHLYRIPSAVASTKHQCIQLRYSLVSSILSPPLSHLFKPPSFTKQADLYAEASCISHTSSSLCSAPHHRPTILSSRLVPPARTTRALSPGSGFNSSFGSIGAPGFPTDELAFAEAEAELRDAS